MRFVGDAVVGERPGVLSEQGIEVADRALEARSQIGPDSVPRVRRDIRRAQMIFLTVPIDDLHKADERHVEVAPDTVTVRLGIVA